MGCSCCSQKLRLAARAGARGPSSRDMDGLRLNHACSKSRFCYNSIIIMHHITASYELTWTLCGVQARVAASGGSPLAVCPGCHPACSLPGNSGWALPAVASNISSQQPLATRATSNLPVQWASAPVRRETHLQLHVRGCLLLPTMSAMAQIALASLLEKLISKVLALHVQLGFTANICAHNSDGSKNDSECKHEVSGDWSPHKSRACAQGLQGC